MDVYEYLLRKRDEELKDAEDLTTGPEEVGETDTYKYPPKLQGPITPADAARMYTDKEKMGIGGLSDYLNNKYGNKTYASPGKLTPELISMRNDMVSKPEKPQSDFVPQESYSSSSKPMDFYKHSMQKNPEIAQKVDKSVSDDEISKLSKLMDKNGLSGLSYSRPVSRSSSSGISPDIVQYMLSKYKMDSQRALDSEQTSNRSRMLNDLGRSFNTIGASIAGVKPDQSYYENSEKVESDRRKGIRDEQKNLTDELAAIAKAKQDKDNLREQIALRKALVKGPDLNKDVLKLSERLEKSGLSELDPVADKINTIINLNGTDDIPGYGLTGSFPDFMVSSRGKEVRQAIQELRNIVLKARSGGAVTPDEAKRLYAELGEGIFRSDRQLRTGLNNVLNSLQSKKQGILAGHLPESVAVYKSRGGDASKMNSSNMPGWTDEKEKKYQMLLQKQRSGNLGG